MFSTCTSTSSPLINILLSILSSPLAWVNYDTLYCHQACSGCSHAASLEWPKVCSIVTCVGTQLICMSSDCVLSAEREPDLVYWLKVLENRVKLIKDDPHKDPGQVMRRNGEVCNLYNKQQCKFYYCKYRDVCSGCGGNHPVLLCHLENRSGAPPSGPN